MCRGSAVGPGVAQQGKEMVEKRLHVLAPRQRRSEAGACRRQHSAAWRRPGGEPLEGLLQMYCVTPV